MTRLLFGRLGTNDLNMLDGDEEHVSTLLLVWVMLNSINCQLLRKFNLNRWSQ